MKRSGENTSWFDPLPAAHACAPHQHVYGERSLIFLQITATCDKLHNMKRNQWEDHYTRRARKEHWAARSIYKLQEIDQKFRIFKEGHHILDLGCYPGSWSQYALTKIGPGGGVFGVDLKVPDRISGANFRFLQADVLALDPEVLHRETGDADVVMSDLAPRTTGVRQADAARSTELVQKASDIARSLLLPRGCFICKVFEGEDFREFRTEVSRLYKQVRVFRTGATRKRSRETYLIAQEFNP
jgi:23S rRNA (uridine2552-2'-O)-methyltransferase